MANSPELWAMVLAGGEGTRLAPLTTALYGRPVPKQFAIVAGTQSMLAQTLERLAHLGVSPTRTIVVATREQEELARCELASFPGALLVLEPCKRDTAAAILIGLSHVMARDPLARVLVVPSDHHVRDTAGFARAMGKATQCWYDPSIAITLLGVRSVSAEEEYGWIVPGRQVSGAAAVGHQLYAVERFVEKPPLDVARELHNGGALWNAFVLAGLARTWWALFEQVLPDETSAFRRYQGAIGTASEPEVLSDVYASIPDINFSRRVLACIPERLGVVACDDVGWSDLGSPRSVFDALAGTPEERLLMQRLNRVARQPMRQIKAHRDSKKSGSPQ